MPLIDGWCQAKGYNKIGLMFLWQVDAAAKQHALQPQAGRGGKATETGKQLIFITTHMRRMEQTQTIK